MIEWEAERRRYELALQAEARKYRWDPLLVVVGAIIAGMFFRLDLILKVLHLSS